MLITEEEERSSQDERLSAPSGLSKPRNNTWGYFSESLSGRGSVPKKAIDAKASRIPGKIQNRAWN